MYFSLYEADPANLMRTTTAQTDYVLSSSLDTVDAIKIFAVNGNGGATTEQAHFVSYHESPWIAVVSIKSNGYVIAIPNVLSIKRVGGNLAGVEISTYSGPIVYRIIGLSLRYS